MLKSLKELFPNVIIQAFTAVEIHHFSQISGLSLKDTLLKLKEAGLDSIPGGGAEIFSTRVRKAICPNKIDGEKWLEVMRVAHELNFKTNATMLYGHIETIEERADHLIRLRMLQDETGGFMAFIPLAYHPKNTKLGGKKTNAFDDLKTLAISRIALDNFPHIKAFWVMLGVKLAQVSLSFGVDDIDGTVEEEYITHSAGAEAPQRLTEEELRSLILEASSLPVRRDTLYNPLN
jgi:aminodeoxyfutalosine synthase